MRLLIIGGFGYIGSTLIQYILDNKEDTITILDRLNFDVKSTYFYNTLNNDRITFVKGDVSDMRLTWNLIQNHDVIIYMAALTLPNSARYPNDAIFVNRHMAEIVGDCCSKFQKPMVFISTCSNYGKSDGLVDENGELFPISIYAISKVDAEKYLLKNIPNLTILRCATAYGVSAGRTRWDVLLNNFIKTALTENKLDIFQPNSHRPICSVNDISRAIYLSSAKMVRDTLNEQQNKTIYNVGSITQNYTKEQLANIVKEFIDVDINITEQEDNRDYKVDFQKITNELGFNTKQTPQTEIPSLIEHCKKEFKL
jgi:nucleoside-diphosphate-sugar epimerase